MPFSLTEHLAGNRTFGMSSFELVWRPLVVFGCLRSPTHGRLMPSMLCLPSQSRFLPSPLITVPSSTRCPPNPRSPVFGPVSAQFSAVMATGLANRTQRVRALVHHPNLQIMLQHTRSPSCWFPWTARVLKTMDPILQSVNLKARTGLSVSPKARRSRSLDIKAIIFGHPKSHITTIQQGTTTAQLRSSQVPAAFERAIFSTSKRPICRCL